MCNFAPSSTDDLEVPITKHQPGQAPLVAVHHSRMAVWRMLFEFTSNHCEKEDY
jgi:hypothetical protein